MRSLLPCSLATALVLSTPFTVRGGSSDQPLTPRTFIDVSKRVLPAVVSISIEVKPDPKFLGKDHPRNLEEFMDRMMRNPEDFRNAPDEQAFGFSAAGSGVIFKVEGDQGFVLTNAHVISQAENADVKLTLDSSYSGDEGEAIEIPDEKIKVLGRDQLTDLAVLQFQVPEGTSLQSADFADSNKLEVGEWVMALGNPLHFNNSVSEGIISAKHRVIYKTPIEDLVQTTAVINPGNSGGPLVNLDGKIVGINNAIASDTGRWQGVGFAIPSTQAERVARMLAKDGKVSRGYLGIEMQQMDEAFAKNIDLDKPHGIIVNRVVAGGPADLAGLQLGDVIVKVDGHKVSDPGDLLREVGARDAEDSVKLSVLRQDNGKLKSIDVTAKLTERPAEAELASLRRKPKADAEQPQLKESEAQDPVEALGLNVRPYDKEGVSGLEVTEVARGSLAAEAGLQEGDILLSINGIKSDSRRKALDGLQNVRPGKQHTVLYDRDGANQFLTLEQAK